LGALVSDDGSTIENPDVQVEPGNIDIHNRPTVHNEDGSISTVRTMGMEDDSGLQVNVPTVSPDGRIMSDDEARQRYEDTGEHLGKYNTIGAAERAAQDLHDAQAREYIKAPEDWQTQARAAGYSWGDINGHVASASATALDAGYTPDKIDEYLGYNDQWQATNRFTTSFSSAFDSDPAALEGLAGAQPKLDLTTGNYRSDYIDALQKREVKGAEDFSQVYAASALDAAHAPGRLDDSNGDVRDARLAAGAGAARDLAGQLPAHADFIDGALALDGGTAGTRLDGGPDTTTKDNLMRHWRDTGQSPIDAAIAAQQDPALYSKLTSPPEKAEPYNQGMSEFQAKLKAGDLEGLTRDLAGDPVLLQKAREAIDPQSMAWLITPWAQGVDTAKSPIEMAERLAEAVLMKTVADVVEPFVVYYGGQALRYGSTKLLNVDFNAPIGQGVKALGLDVFADTAGTFKPLNLVSGLFSRADEGAIERAERGGVFNDLAARQAKEIVSGDRIANPITAFHASPHDFDSFSTEYLGTGEAGRAKGEEVNDINRRGNGLYFSTNPVIHDFYLGSLGVDQVVKDGAKTPYDILNPEHVAAQKVFEITEKQRGSGTLGTAPSPQAVAIHNLSYADSIGRTTPTEKEALDVLKSDKELPEFRSSNINDYRVKLHITPDKLLDLDKPIKDEAEKLFGIGEKPELPVATAEKPVTAEQTAAYEKQVQEWQDKLAEHHLTDLPDDMDRVTGQVYFDELAAKLGGTKNASDFLAGKGVTGTQYFDAASRSGGKAELKYWQDQLAAHEDAISKLPRMIADAKAGNDLDFLPELKVKALEESLQNRQNSLSKVKDEIAKIEAAPDTRTRNYVMFHASPVEMFEKNGQKIEPAQIRQQTEAMTEGYKTLAGLKDHFKNLGLDLWKDESGALKLFSAKREGAVEAKADMQTNNIKQGGLREQTLRQFAERLDGLRKTVNQHMPEWEAELEKLAKTGMGDPMSTTMGQGIAYAEGHSSGVVLPPDHPMTPVFDTIREINQELRGRREAAEAEGLIGVQGYWDDYLSHFVKDPAKTADYLRGIGKLGSSASFKARTYPTIADLVNSGHELAVKDPIEMTLRNAQGSLRYLDAIGEIDQGVKDGWVEWRKPNAGFGTETTDYVPLNGAMARKSNGDLAYAHPDWALSWNRMSSRGMFNDPAGQATHDMLTYASNTATAIKLFSPLFHLRTVGLGSLAGGLAQAMDEGLRGDVVKALATAAKSPFRPIMDYVIGRGVNKDYLAGDNPVVQDLVQAGLRINRAGTFQTLSKAPSLYDSIRWGSLMRELRDDVQHVKDSGSIFGKDDGAVWRSVGLIGREMGRLMSLVNEPVFGHFIPTVQAGMSMQRYQSWLDANRLASPDLRIKMARKFVMDAENRMGELNLDTVFMPKAAQQMMSATMISPSWMIGTYRGWAQAGKAVAGLAKGDVRQFMEYSPLLTAFAGGALGWALINAAANAYYTGELPGTGEHGSWQDFLNARTGTLTKSGAPRRLMMPTELKEAYDIGNIAAKASGGHPVDALSGLVSYLSGKGTLPVSTLMDSIRSTAQLGGVDAIGRSIEFTPGGLKKYLWEQARPILVDNILKSGKPGFTPEASGIGTIGRILGDREAPGWVTDWNDYQAKMNGARARIQKQAIQRYNRDEGESEPVPGRGGGGRATGPGSRGGQGRGSRGGYTPPGGVWGGYR
jgi:hypothetical protein